MGTLAKINGIAVASIAKMNGIAKASISKVDGHSWPASGANFSEGFESSSWASNSSWTSFNTFATGEDTIACFSRNATAKYTGSYGCNINDQSGTNPVVCRRNYGKQPASIRMRFRADSTVAQYLLLGYGPRDYGADYELGGFAAFSMGNGRLYTCAFSTSGDINTGGGYSTAGTVSNGTWYWLEASYSTTNSTTTVTATIYDLSENVIRTRTDDWTNTNWSNDIFFGMRHIEGVTAFYVDDIEVYDT